MSVPTGSRDRPSTTLAVDHITERHTEVSNTNNNLLQVQGPVISDFPVGNHQHISGGHAGPNVNEIAYDNSMAGPRPGTTSRNGGTIPYHTSGLWSTRSPLQDRPKPYFYRRT
jgi:hypothetical protein